MSHQQGFKFGRRYLEPLVFNQLFQTINNREMTVFIDMANVSGV